MESIVSGRYEFARKVLMGKSCRKNRTQLRMAPGLDFTSDVWDADCALVFLSGGFLGNQLSVSRLADLIDHLEAQNLVYVYDVNLGWNFEDIYDMQAKEMGKGGIKARMDALKVRYSIMLRQGIAHRPLHDGAFIKYEHEALQVLSML